MYGRRARLPPYRVCRYGSVGGLNIHTYIGPSSYCHGPRDGWSAGAKGCRCGGADGDADERCRGSDASAPCPWPRRHSPPPAVLAHSLGPALVGVVGTRPLGPWVCFDDLGGVLAHSRACHPPTTSSTEMELYRIQLYDRRVELYRGTCTTSLIEFSNCIGVTRSACLRGSGCRRQRAGRRRRL